MEAGCCMETLRQVSDGTIFGLPLETVLLFKLGVIYDNSSAHQTKDIAKNWCIREKHFFVNNPNEQFQIIPHDKQEIN